MADGRTPEAVPGAFATPTTAVPGFDRATCYAGAERRPAGVPAWLPGVWRRRARSLDGGRLEEPSDVLWLQVGEHFADVRVAGPGVGATPHPLDASQAFSGQVSHRQFVVTWVHDLDTTARPPGHRDTAEVAVEGDVLVERGVRYLEEWRRQHAPGPTAVLEARGSVPGELRARIVRIGNLAAAVWRCPAPGGAALVLQRAEWQAVAVVPAGPTSASTDVQAILRASLQPGAVLPAGWRQVDGSGAEAGTS